MQINFFKVVLIVLLICIDVELKQNYDYSINNLYYYLKEIPCNRLNLFAYSCFKLFDNENILS